MSLPFPEYESFDALALAHEVQRGAITPSELLDAAIARCEARNPELNAVVIPLFEEARAQLENRVPDGPFCGVPFLLKDLALQLIGTRTTGGSRFFADHVADHDSELVRRYREAGLVIFGKTASPEFGLTTTTESLLHGATRNPWNTAYTSGGSSGGASAAVAAGILPLANASDGGGSIRIPASCCGLFGLKPTRGRVPPGPRSLEGWSGLSTIHAVSRSVRDSAALLDATAGPELGAPYVAPPFERPLLEETVARPGQLRIAFQRESFNGAPTHPDCVTAVEDAAELCRELGHEVHEARLEIDAEKIGEASSTIITANVRMEIDARAESLGRPPAEDELETLTRLMLAGGDTKSASDYARSLRAVHALGRQVASFLLDFDLVLTPTMATPPREIGELSLSNPNLEELANGLLATSAFTQIFNLSGNPAASVPLHWNDAGLPVGVQFAARFGDEATLIRIASQLESARPWFERRPPGLAGG